MSSDYDKANELNNIFDNVGMTINSTIIDNISINDYPPPHYLPIVYLKSIPQAEISE